MGIVSEIKDFYFFYHSCAEIKPQNTKEYLIKTSLCGRMDFVAAAFDAHAYLIYNVALTVLSATAFVFTLGFIPSFKASLYENAYDALVHAGSIPVSFLGILFPQIVNRDFLKLTAHESVETLDSGTLSKVIQLLGKGIVLRKRRPLQAIGPSTKGDFGKELNKITLRPNV
ncbi:MAG: hypothetical protein K2P51_01210 [Rhabdochlamydiaceae bacterium]|nr:hypothetical protein [Rhabdochlamydiaceae bacterium]